MFALKEEKMVGRINRPCGFSLDVIEQESLPTMEMQGSKNRYEEI